MDRLKQDTKELLSPLLTTMSKVQYNANITERAQKK